MTITKTPFPLIYRQCEVCVITKNYIIIINWLMICSHLGVIGALAWALGPIISGQIVTRKKKFTPYYAMKIIVVITFMTCVGYAGMMFMACPTEQWAGKLGTDKLVYHINTVISMTTKYMILHLIRHNICIS